MEGARGSRGEHVAGIPALDAAVQGYQAGRAVGHVIYRISGVHLAVVHALYLQLQNVRHLVGRDKLRAEGEEGGEILHDG